MRKKAKRIFSQWDRDADNAPWECMADKRATKYAEHLAMCSCPMCGNPRKAYKEKTRQEQKAELDDKDVG
jgi:hypothetical protein